MTTYIKVKAYPLVSYDSKTGDEVDVKLTRNTLRHNYQGINYCFNQHLVVYGVVNFERFRCSGELKPEDWTEYLHPEDGVSSNVTSILPIYLGVEEPEMTDEDFAKITNYGEFLNTELDVYLYIKVESKEAIKEKEMKALLDYISGQLSDGWGEGFEQKPMNFTEYSKSEEKFSFRDLYCYVSFEWEPEKFEIVDKVNRNYF